MHILSQIYSSPSLKKTQINVTSLFQGDSVQPTTSPSEAFWARWHIRRCFWPGTVMYCVQLYCTQYNVHICMWWNVLCSLWWLGAHILKMCCRGTPYCFVWIGFVPCSCKKSMCDLPSNNLKSWFNGIPQNRRSSVHKPLWLSSFQKEDFVTHPRKFSLSDRYQRAAGGILKQLWR